MKGKIFNAQEVQAIIAGNKTMFREVIKPKINLENYSLPDECGMELLLSECPYQVGQKIFCKNLTLQIKEIRAEKLQHISQEDCEKEGIGYTGGWNGEDYDDGEFFFGKLIETEDGMNWKNEMFEYPDLAFEKYWDSTHKKPKEKFEANPFVWVVDFKINK